MFSLFNMGNSQISKVNFEDVQSIKATGLLINTLPLHEQECLITGTISATNEVKIINSYLSKNKNINLIIYGKNSNDETIYEKYKQLQKLGFVNVKLYIGGIFEWLLLQDIYGEEEFPTTKKQLDILKFKPNSSLSTSLIAIS